MRRSNTRSKQSYVVGEASPREGFTLRYRGLALSVPLLLSKREQSVSKSCYAVPLLLSKREQSVSLAQHL
ncbi:MAG: hypothetical protein V7L20_12260 [Nostoc sp.]|uniref:hypothetical protein n=1 Tax=Nostoc sp. TaxID=1180 RepID=UPI002FF97F0C